MINFICAETKEDADKCAERNVIPGYIYYTSIEQLENIPKYEEAKVWFYDGWQKVPDALELQRMANLLATTHQYASVGYLPRVINFVQLAIMKATLGITDKMTQKIRNYYRVSTTCEEYKEIEELERRGIMENFKSEHSRVYTYHWFRLTYLGKRFLANELYRK